MPDPGEVKRRTDAAVTALHDAARVSLANMEFMAEHPHALGPIPHVLGLPGDQIAAELNERILETYRTVAPFTSAVGLRLTPEEREVRVAARRARDEAEAALMAQLTAHRDPPTVAVLALHALGNTVTRTCDGCDQGDYSQSDADWPCRTVVTLARAHGIQIPEHLT